MIFVSSSQSNVVAVVARQFQENLMTFEWFWLSYRENEKVNEGREAASTNAMRSLNYQFFFVLSNYIV